MASASGALSRAQGGAHSPSSEEQAASAQYCVSIQDRSGVPACARVRVGVANVTCFYGAVVRVGRIANGTDFEGLVLCLFYAYSDFSDGFSVC